MTDERKALYWLATSKLSLAKQNSLLEIFDSAIDIIKSINSEKIREFAGDKAYARMKATIDEAVINKELYALSAYGLKLLIRGYRGYPEKLDESTNPPLILYTKGNIKLLEEKSLCVIGTRRCSEYGRKIANEWTAALCSKFVIVSGYATGIDTYAVESCIKAGGRAIIVLACGHNKFKLPEYLKNVPQDRYLLISEYEPDFVTQKHVYSERNRLLSGLSDGVLIIEASEQSGALITANHAANQNRTVFAVPGDIFSEKSKGVNKLLRHGAVAVTSVQDICEDMQTDYKEEPEEVFNLSADEQRVYDLLKEGINEFDDIVQSLGMLPHEVSGLLSMMELQGIIERRMQNRYALKK